MYIYYYYYYYYIIIIIIVSINYCNCFIIIARLAQLTRLKSLLEQNKSGVCILPMTLLFTRKYLFLGATLSSSEQAELGALSTQFGDQLQVKYSLP